MMTLQEDPSNNNLFKRPVPVYLIPLAILVSFFIVYYFFPSPSKTKKTTIVSVQSDCADEMEILRNKDFKFTHPAYLYDVRNENPAYAPLKEKLNQFIALSKSSKGLMDISIYFRNLNTGEWFTINGGQVYNPASLIKVAFLIAMLKQSSGHPQLLDKQVFFARHYEKANTPNIIDFKLEEQKYYSIKQLLYYMIVNSDNDAAELIRQNVKPDVVIKVFSDLGLPLPPVKAEEYFISVIDYCKFFRVLFNASYLGENNSDLALEFLSKSTFKEGLLKDLHITFPVAHKFGERIMNDIEQLHETGIFYTDQKPYLLGVMSSGHNLKELSSILSQVSQIVYLESTKLN